MAEIFQNREQIIEHVGIYIAEHRKRFSCIAGAFGQPIAGVHCAACGWALMQELWNVPSRVYSIAACGWALTPS